MFKEKLLKIKEKLNKNGNNKKLIENMVVFVILLIVTVVIINYIWAGTNKENKVIKNETNTKTLAETTKANTENTNELETKLEKILSKIKGVGEVSVLITYSKTNELVPIYNEDNSQTTTEEKTSEGITKTTNENTNKKEIIYEENEGEKTLATKSVVSPIIEGAIISAKGAADATIKSNIIAAVEAATGLSTHKIQVFEMN